MLTFRFDIQEKMIECKIYFNSKTNKFRSHSCQALAGFIELEKQKRISLKIDYDSDMYIPLTNTFRCEINKRMCFYDTEDGTENLNSKVLEYIRKNNILLFKRAYDEKEYKNEKLIRPYGLNYIKRINSPFESVTIYLISRKFFSPRFFHHFLLNINDWSVRDYTREHVNKILFCTRLWEQKNTVFSVDALNETRIQTALFLRKHFHGNVISGLIDSPLSRKMCKDLILTSKITNRKRFLELVQNSTVCVTTTGLHHSIGWRFGEFVASGKAIVSKPLFFSVPGDFHDGKNNLTFTTLDQLAERCEFLLTHEKERRSMEYNNIDYYFHYLRPDVLIWNTIKQVVDI